MEAFTSFFPLFLEVFMSVLFFVLIILFAIAAAIVLVLLGIRREEKNYNGGICRKCGEPLNNYAMDSQRGRGYQCPSCGYECWVSYSGIDDI